MNQEVAGLPGYSWGASQDLESDGRNSNSCSWKGNTRNSLHNYCCCALEVKRTWKGGKPECQNKK